MEDNIEHRSFWEEPRIVIELTPAQAIILAAKLEKLQIKEIKSVN